MDRTVTGRGPYGDRTKWSASYAESEFEFTGSQACPWTDRHTLTVFAHILLGVNSIFALTFVIVSKSQTLK
jgi:hypothetical protein